MFLSSLDLAVNVALPDITSNLGTDLRTVQWVIVLYVGGSVSLQLGLGSAADAYGLRRFYIIGLAAYALAVLLIGLAPNLSTVLGLRVMQAVGAALISASAPALITAIFPSEQRGRALGLMSAISTLGMISATLGGGVLVETFGWRSIFLARVPLTLLTVALALIILSERKSGERPQFDLRGGLLAMLGLACLVLFLTFGGRIGWLSPLTLALGIGAAVTLTVLLRLERGVQNPVFDPKMLTNPLLLPVIIAALLLFMTIFLNLFILPFYVSDVLKADAKAMGFLLMLATAFAGVAAPIGGWLSVRLPPAYITTGAQILSTVVLFWFSALTAGSSLNDVAVRMAIGGIGMGVFQATNATLIMGAVPSDRLGTGGALISLSMSMGIVTSVALLGGMFDGRLAMYEATTSDASQAFVMAFRDTYIVAGVITALAVAVSLSYWPQVLRWRMRLRV
ncbi:MAG: MFS transporter [Chloroflexi bacterium]|nr:MFS transporter [Chloroflexota bacterium]